MKKSLAAILFALSLFCPAIADAQICNDPSGFIKTNGPIAIGDQLVMGPGCQQVSDGGAAAPPGSFNVTLGPYFADPTGTVNSQAAINAAIAAICFPTPKGKIFIPAGIFLVNGGVNATNIPTGCTIDGAGETATILRATTSTNVVLDLTGSSAVFVNNLQISAPTAVANIGILFSSAGPPSTFSPCNVNHFTGVSVTGKWIKAGVAIFDCSDSSFENSQVSCFNTGAFACFFISATNDLTASSSFTNIITGTTQSGDWRFSSLEIHELSTFSPPTLSTVPPLFISGSFSPIKFIGGIVAGSVAAANGGMVTFGGVPTGGVSFIGTQMYADNGITSKFAFWTYNVFTGLTVKGSKIQYATSLLSQANGATWSSMDISGNDSFGGAGSFVTPTTAATITRSIIDAQGLAINLGAGGTLTHTVMIQPGAITAGTQTANGSF